MIPFRLDYIIERTVREGACEEQKFLKRVAGVRLSPKEAREEWRRIIEHKWFVSERLGRDVGMRVAAIDYFDNVRLPRRAHGTSKPQSSRLLRATRPRAVHA